MKQTLKRISKSFACSSLAGVLVYLIIDLCVGYFGGIEDFNAIPPAFIELFPTPVIAAYANILVYGIIGATFSGMSFIFEINRLGFVIQYLIYFLITGTVLTFITLFLWQLQNIPAALISTLIGYAVSFLIVGIIQYRLLKQDINKINELIEKDE